MRAGATVIPLNVHPFASLFLLTPLFLFLAALLLFGRAFFLSSSSGGTTALGRRATFRGFLLFLRGFLLLLCAGLFSAGRAAALEGGTTLFRRADALLLRFLHGLFEGANIFRLALLG